MFGKQQISIGLASGPKGFQKRNTNKCACCVCNKTCNSKCHTSLSHKNIFEQKLIQFHKNEKIAFLLLH